MSSSRSGSATTGLLSDVVDRVLLAEAGVRVLEAVARVLHLDLRRSPRWSRRRGPSGGGRRGRSTPGWWRRAGGSAASRGRSCARRRPARRSPSASCRHRSRARRRRSRRGSAPAPRATPARPRRRRRSSTAIAHARPAELLGEGRAGDEAGVAVADRVGAGDVLDVASTASPASASAARAATMPYSVKSSPHLPHGCMPTPRIATSSLAASLHDVDSSLASLHRRRPHVHEVLVVVVAVEDVDARAPSPCRPSARRPARPWRPARARRSPRRPVRPRRARTARTAPARRRAGAARSGSRCTTTPGPGATARSRSSVGAVARRVGAVTAARREDVGAALGHLAPMRCGCRLASRLVNQPSTAGTRVTVSDTGGG